MRWQMKWIVAIALLLCLFPLMVLVLIGAKRAPGGKGRVAGAALAIGIAFTIIFDPAKAAAIETLRKQEDIGDATDGHSESDPEDRMT